MRLIHHITHHVALGWLDRLAGALFGAVKYLVILSIVLNLVHIIDPKGKLIPEKETASSQFYGYTWHKSRSFRKPNRRGDCLYLIRYATSRISVVKIVKQIKNETG